MIISKWRQWAPSLFFVGIAVFLFKELIFEGKAFIGSADRFLQFVPSMQLMAEGFSQGYLPQWNPYVFCGSPLWGDQTLRPLYPLNWIVAVFFPSNVALGTSWRLFIELVLIMKLSNLFFMKVWKDSSLALFSTLAYSLSIGAIENLNHDLMFASFVYFPWVLSILWDWEERPLRRNIVYLSLAMGLQITAGYYQLNAYLFLFAACLALARCCRLHGGATLPVMGRLLLLLAGSASLAFLLNAPELFPFINNVFSSSRAAVPYKVFYENFGQPWYMIFRILLPYFLGDYSGFPLIHGKGDINVYEAFPAYAGICAFFFSVLALARPMRNRTWPWLAAVVFIILASLKTPFFYIPYLLFNKFSLMHGRLALLLPLCMAFLAPLGMNIYLKQEAKGQGRIVLSCGICTVIFFIFASGSLGPLFSFTSILPLTSFTTPEGSSGLEEKWRQASLLFLAGGAALLAILYLRLAGRLTEKNFKNACVALLALDLLLMARTYTLRKEFVPPEEWLPKSPLTEFIEKLPDKDQFRFSIEPGVAWAPHPSTARRRFGFNLNIPYKLRAVNGYLSLVHKNFSDLTDLGSLFHGRTFTSMLISKDGADLLGIKYFVATKNSLADRLHSEFADIIFSWKDTLVRAKKNPHSRFYLACQAVETASPKEMWALLRLKKTNLADTIFIPPGANLTRNWSYCIKDDGAGINMEEKRPGLLRGSFKTLYPALLAIAEVYDPGWRAFINGKPVKIHRANQAFQAIELPTGEGSIEFRYRSSGLTLGLACCLLALVILRALWLPWPNRR